jgi:heme oxygenase
MLTQPFHEQILAATEASHRSAERTTFIVELMGGKLDQRAYLRYLAALAPIYEKMEALLRERADRPLVKRFDHRGLDRFDRMRTDIAVLSERVGVEAGVDLPETTARYVSRLHDGIEDERLLAHHYIRYLGDLSGGQAIARLVVRHYQVPPEALTFYDFPDLGDANHYKAEYRERLNSAQLTEAQRHGFIDEAMQLYALSGDLFTELGQA